MFEIDIEKILEALHEASQAILEIYNQDFQIFAKKDFSPLTQADKASQEIIVNFLAEFTPDIPLISEEDDLPDWHERKQWEYFWLLDPLDGTKEFIDKNGEFTINLALIHRNQPVLGFIQVPALQSVYWAEKGKGTFKREKEGITQKIQGRKNVPISERIAVVSRSHASMEDKKALDKFQIKQVIVAGSSLKFCFLAEGKADFYYRHNPTMEWDTAAGQILVEEAGGKVLDEKNQPLTYNKPTLLNGSFYCKMF
ncbi:MAG: 3'(2'),5'-bisphosphate nucleotidase CysQ [Raineya sp.]|nr:3'(2'),5'-bisphosphate nucleotidase CysQ [Raineya sp.]MDW8295502.1 3'(2'),5'-bisphosphate nucleotidase CysQ [Raineya sp.]